MKRIESLLAREIGLSLQSIGENALISAVNIRMATLGIGDREQYADQILLDEAERRALVEEIVVSETWFFRDLEVFHTLARQLTTCRAANPHRKLRVLSIPCATGEEAYSVAMVLLEQGLKPANFDVCAVDVSARALSAAERASYGKKSFRGNSAHSWRHYFESGRGDELRPLPVVREAVTFVQGNVLDASASWAQRRFDIIFCRNLLIYLDREARSRALQNLKRWLADKGIVFAGHAESLDTMDPGLQRMDRTTHFAYTKRDNGTPTPQSKLQVQPGSKAVRRGTSPTKPLAVKAMKRPHEGNSVESTRLPPRAAAPPTQPLIDTTDLDSALALANRGELAEAIRICERHLALNGATAEAYCLLGIVKQAGADSHCAMQCFDKALYLEPDHYQALVHLALLHERRGDRSRAENLRRRAERALAGRPTR